MQKTTTNNILFTVASNAQLFRFQQHVLTLANRAAAHSLNRLEGLVPMLRDSPFTAIRSRASYFEAVLQARSGGTGGLERLALVADHETRASSLLSLGYFSYRAQDYESAGRFYHEASLLVPADCPLLSFRILKSQATNLTLLGNHAGSVRLFETIFPFSRLVSRIDPLTYFDSLNSYSLALAEVGRFDEAIGAARQVAGSSAVKIYPVWGDSLREIVELRGLRRRQRQRPKSADVLSFQERAVEIDYFKNKHQLFHAAVDPDISPARVKLSADVANPLKLDEGEIEQVQRVVNSIVESKHRNRTSAIVVKLEQSK